jgi:lactam utilization protein B
MLMYADPGYPDKAGFGRRALAMSYEQAYAEM